MPSEKQIKYWESKKGKPSWNKGKSWNETTKKKMRDSKLKKPMRYWLGKKRPEMSGKDNNKWKGDDASYFAIHIWVSGHFGKASDYPCSFCEKRGGSRQMHWANIDHKYSRNKKDWMVMCVKCHCNYDKIFLGTKRGGNQLINTNV